MWSSGKPCRILCTQPRRISASSGWYSAYNCELASVSGSHNYYQWEILLTVAERIASERGEPIGETVGYQVFFLENFLVLDFMAVIEKLTLLSM